MPETTPVSAPVLPALPAPSAQAERLIELGVHETAGLSAAEVRAFAATGEDLSGGGALLAVHPDRAPASALAPLLRRAGKPGFVVVDMPDVDLFAPLDTVALPDAPLYFLTGLDRGDHMANWSPDEALPALNTEARTPAIWISNGTGRDGRERRDAPKVGWCWAGNRHTWLGFASATGRRTA
ncbi:DUF5701 family protein [Streptomyces sp. NPDC046727]|uniref:DUF5701 family protein n=1 Tax=Streptomyces sp. NPDC046727 TaxID=3155373 RepID=UPI0033EDFFF3